MTIRIHKTGEVVPNAHWFGFNWWARAWMGDGWGHWSSSAFTVVDERDTPHQKCRCCGK